MTMRIDIVDEKRGVLKVKVESEDDLWLLNLLISPGDVVKGLTLRDVSFGYEKRKVPMVLSIKVLKKEFQAFTNRMRVHGIVVEGPDRFGVKGSHHTINIDVGSEVEISKEVWNPRMLDELSKFTRPIKVLLVALDYDEFATALVTGQGVKMLIYRELSLPISDEALEHVLHQTLKELAKLVAETATSTGAEAVVIGSPGSLKDRLKEPLEEYSPGIRIYLDSVANGGPAGINELLRREVIKRVLEETAVMKSVEFFDEFDALLSKDPDRVAYTMPHVRTAVELGAAEKLAVLDELLFSDDTEGHTIAVVKRAMDTGSRIIVVPSESEPGIRLKMLGGIAAILRYRLPPEVFEESGKT